MIKNDSAQSGILVIVIAGLFLIGIAWVFMGQIMSSVQDANNNLISDPNMHYTDRHWETIDGIFKWWMAIPLYIILLFAIYAFKKSLDKQSGTL